MGVVKRYPFTPSFEQLLAATMASVRPLADRFANDLDPDMMNLEIPALVLRAVRALVLEVGHGPSSAAVVVQKLRLWMDDGKVTFDQLTAATDLLADTDPGTEDDLAVSIIPVIQQSFKEHAIRSAIQSLSAPTGFEDIIANFERVKNVGKKSASIGTTLGKGGFAMMAKLRHIDKLPTGIVPLDMLMRGGLGRGQQGVVVGGYGTGKSMFLSSQAAVAAMMGLNVGYVTLELNPGIVLGRIQAAILDMPIDEIMGDRFDEAETMIETMLPNLGTVVVEEMTPKKATHLDIYDWMQRVYKQQGRKIDVLLVDYADKLASPKHKENDSSYVAMETVYEGLRLIADSEGIWEWTASQPQRKGKDKRGTVFVPGGDDMADSLNKARVTDVLIGMGASSDGQGYLYGIDKHRTVDCAGKTVGPVPHKRWCGRMFL